ncbi:putative proteasome endopeptidase complex [Helianthus debilis subsp. tardiflorus]
MAFYCDTSNVVVIATEKKLPSILVDETSVQKIQILTPNIGVVYSGMGPDLRVLVRKSRKQAEQYNLLQSTPHPYCFQLVRTVRVETIRFDSKRYGCQRIIKLNISGCSSFSDNALAY